MVQFWYEFASSYSYPAAMRVEEEAEQRGIAIEWRPFLLGPLFKEQQGLSDSPFNEVAVKGRYMWRDLERICASLKIPFSRPMKFPQNGLAAARLALVGLREGWGKDFSRAVFRANFAEGLDIGDPGVLEPIVRACGGDPRSSRMKANSDEIKDKLRGNVDTARARGIFGAPTFVCDDGELFWGNDRLEQALDWACEHEYAGRAAL
ncbi:2-hydroxychromene-2-carboxylate isomerase [Hartmannibacter diazotrophicus]|uniref:2-hydroxychromene-2-carboxylate isomerase n=1 Tax=Hartmannibacter diazotrophicus TaxID=1482074 RepID=A0A2C9D4C8_9HYPH|nr:2-hydroxychromene-2-carboxylate isomerase [Hartmannibacter diazotrophicus]SON55083.1 2-hydroxychromene-2-carboxylate isomerase [Hartmannibacter diazotrophicus]